MSVYGTDTRELARGFSWQPESTSWLVRRRASPQLSTFGTRIFLSPILSNGRPIPAGRRPICLRYPITRTLPRWCRNVDLLLIDYAFRPRLRVRLTQGGLTFPRKPWISGVQGSHLDGVTYAGRVTSMRSIGPHGPTSTPMERSSTNATVVALRSFGDRLEPR